MPDAPQYLDARGNAMTSAPDALDAQGNPIFTTKNGFDANGNPIVDDSFVSGAGEYLNPVTAIRGVNQAASHPIDTVKAIGQAQVVPLQKAKDAYQQGDYITAARHFVDYLLPIIGPALDKSADEAQAGRYRRSAGEAVGLGLSLFGPSALGQTRTATTAATAASRATPAVQDAVAFGAREGVPVDAATATQNRAVAAIQHLSDRTIGGSLVAQRADQAAAQALTAAGERLAGRVSSAPATAESAGIAARTGVEDAVRNFAADAENAYGRAEALAAQKAQTVQTGTKTVQTGVLDAQGNPIVRTQPVTATLDAPLDFGAFKQAVQPLYDRLSREAQLVPLQGAKARALTALDRVMRGPDTVSLMDAERAASDLGALAGSAELPELRNAGQASAAQAFARLRTQIDKAAAAAGPDVLDALQQGRAATKAKYATADILESLSDEPVRTTGRLTAPKDVAVDQLRNVASVAPSTLPQIGRAVLDGMLAKATEAGGFDHAARLYSQWQNIGPQTKALLFGKTADDLDRFFLLAKKLAENPNPSGTAHVVSMGAQGAALFADPIAAVSAQVGGAGLSAALRNPTLVRLLNHALSLELGKAPAVARAAAWQALRQAPRVNVLTNGTRNVPAASAATP